MRETLKLNKINMRKKYLEIRENISPEERLEKSKKIFDKLTESDIYIRSKNIMCYVSFRAEVNTHDFIKKALSDGKNVYIPVIIENSQDSDFKHEMKISKLNDLSELKENKMGILEPVKGNENFEDSTVLDLIIVPGVVFDTRGYRIGHGGGYYDRFLAHLNSKKSGVEKIGVCYRESYVDEVPYDIFDEKVSSIITD